jgi:integrase
MARGKVVPFIARVASSDDAKPKGLPLPRLMELLAERVWPQLADSTERTYHQTRRLSLALGDYPSAGDVAQWVAALRSLYPPPPGQRDSWTVHLHWHNLAAVYSKAQRWGWSSGANPAALLALPKPKARARAVENLAELWAALLGVCEDHRERALLTTARYTGARRGELLGLQPHDLVTFAEPWRLRFERQRPRANAWTTKPLKVEGSNRALPVIAPELRRALVETIAAGAPRVWVGRGGQHLVESPFLFPYRSHELARLKARLEAVAPEAFPRGDFLHVLRHTLAVELNRSGASDEEVQHVHGHSSVTTTRQVYINVFAAPVPASTFERAERARRAGVTQWGAPPGKNLPPPATGSPAADRSGARPVGAGRAPRPDEQSHPFKSKEQSCGPRRAVVATKRTARAARGTLAKDRRRAGQRALPGLAVGPVVRRGHRTR